MTVEALLVSYCVLIVIASVAGGRLSSLLRMTHLRTQLLMSFVGGLMLGIATLHLLPHAAATLGSSGKTGAGALVGVVAMFLLMRMFHPHQHDAEMALPEEMALSEGGALPWGEAGGAEATVGDGASEGEGTRGGPGKAVDFGHGEEHKHSHGHGHGHEHERGNGHGRGECAGRGRRGLGWIGMVFGLGLHTLIDGVALSASVVSDAEHGAWLGLAGLGTFLAVALHKPLDAFAITSTMRAGGWARGHRDLINLMFSMACPLGAALFYVGVTRVDGNEVVLGWGLALSAGFFLCIALADLLPEVSFHDHDRGKLTAALFLGIALAIVVENFPGHEHGPGDGHGAGHEHREPDPGHRHGSEDSPHSGHDH